MWGDYAPKILNIIYYNRSYKAHRQTMKTIMKKSLLISSIACLSLLASVSSIADEGMWQPKQLPALKTELSQMGMKINPKKLSQLSEYPMNAIISLGGCSASFVSPKGLVATNHHCAYGSIQFNSSPESNLLENGFLAKDLAEELPAAPGSRVYVTEEVTDVTDKVNAQLDDSLKGRARFDKIQMITKATIAECEQQEGYRCRMPSFHGGLEYNLIKQLEIQDVRLVHAPAAAIGKYGGDVDNWIWPRHTGDYAFYRAYVSKDGKPAEYKEDNVPYEPKHFLKVNPKGVQNGDFVMVAGYPGRTNRYRLATEVSNTINWSYPTRIREYNLWLDKINELSVNDKDTKIKYASLVASLNNAEKNNRGMLDGFAISDVVERKMLLESDLQTWINTNPKRKDKYATTLETLNALVAEDQATQVRDFYYGFMAQRSALLGSAKTIYRLAKEKEKPDLQRQQGYQERDFDRIKQGQERLERRYTKSADQALWKLFIQRYAKIDPANHVTEFNAWFGINGNDLDESQLSYTLDKMYSKTSLDQLETRLALLDASVEDLEKSTDPFMQLAVALYDTNKQVEDAGKTLSGKLQETRPQYMQAIIDYKTELGEPIYADANSTLRVTVGNVKGYSAKDAVQYTPFTSLRGILQKDTGIEPFNSPQNQLDAINAKEYGPYFEKSLDSVPVNFLSTLDITGGNSGSATLDKNAEFVGLVFDGNYESINADWDFNEKIARSIHVDVRYMLWTMDKLYGADNLLKEMGVNSAF